MLQRVGPDSKLLVFNFRRRRMFKALGQAPSPNRDAAPVPIEMREPSNHVMASDA